MKASSLGTGIVPCIIIVTCLPVGECESDATGFASAEEGVLCFVDANMFVVFFVASDDFFPEHPLRKSVMRNIRK